MTVQSSTPFRRGSAKRRSDLVRGAARRRGDRQGRAGDGELRLSPRCSITTASRTRSSIASPSGSTATCVSAETIRRAFEAALGRRSVARRGDPLPIIVGRLRPRPGLRPRYIEPVLYFKGFHAIQTHRLAHWLWGKRPARLRPLSAEPVVGGLPDRHPSGGADRDAASSSTMPPASSSARRR